MARRLRWESVVGTTVPDPVYFVPGRRKLWSLGALVVIYYPLALARASFHFQPLWFLISVALSALLLVFLATGSRVAWWLMFVRWVASLLDALYAITSPISHAGYAWAELLISLVALYIVTGIWRPSLARPLT
jgi:hypothetical protein